MLPTPTTGDETVSTQATNQEPSPSRALRGKLKLGVTRLCVLLAVVFSLRYFWWRASSTLTPAALWFFYLFLGAELLNFLEAALFYFTTWKRTQRDTIS